MNWILILSWGLVYKAKGDNKKALKVFKKIQKKDKDYRSVNNEIVRLTSL